MEEIEILEEKTSTSNSFVEVNSIEVPKEEIDKPNTESYFDGSDISILPTYSLNVHK